LGSQARGAREMSESSTKLRVSNVSKIVTSEHLKDLFSSFGELASIKQVEDSGEAGTYTVEFKQTADAEQAVALSGTKLGDRDFQVEILGQDGKPVQSGEKGEKTEKKEEGKKDEKTEGGVKDTKHVDDEDDDDDDDDDDDSDRRSRKRRKKRDRRSRSRGRRRRSGSRDRRRRRSRDKRRRNRGRRRRRRDDSSDDSDEQRARRKRNVNPTPTKFWDGFQWHDISAGQPQGLENRPLASQVNMSQLLKAQQEAMASVQ